MPKFKAQINVKIQKPNQEGFDRRAPRVRSAAIRQNARPSGRGGFTFKHLSFI